MTTISIWTVALVAVILIALAAILLLSSGGKERGGEGSVESVISTPSSSIVTVRKVGQTTRVDIRLDVHDHWEGEGGVAPKPTPVEITRLEQPSLYEEYMSSEATATRKYEIADELYSMGYTLPFIPGLHEQLLREQKAVRAEREDPPEAPRGDDVAPNRLDINHDLVAEPVPPMGGDDPEEEAAGGYPGEPEPAPGDYQEYEQ